MKKTNFYRAVCAPEDPSLLEEIMVFHHLHALKSSHDIGQKATSSVHHQRLSARARVSQFTLFREITFLHRDPIFVWVPVGAVTENLRKTRGSRELFGCEKAKTLQERDIKKSTIVYAVFDRDRHNMRESWKSRPRRGSPDYEGSETAKKNGRGSIMCFLVDKSCGVCV